MGVSDKVASSGGTRVVFLIKWPVSRGSKTPFLIKWPASGGTRTVFGINKDGAGIAASIHITKIGMTDRISVGMGFLLTAF